MNLYVHKELVKFTKFNISVSNNANVILEFEKY